MSSPFRRSAAPNYIQQGSRGSFAFEGRDYQTMTYGEGALHVLKAPGLIENNRSMAVNAGKLAILGQERLAACNGPGIRVTTIEMPGLYAQDDYNHVMAGFVEDTVDRDGAAVIVAGHSRGGKTARMVADKLGAQSVRAVIGTSSAGLINPLEAYDDRHAGRQFMDVMTRTVQEMQGINESAGTEGAASVARSLARETFQHATSRPPAFRREVGEVLSSLTHEQGRSLVTNLGEMAVAEMPGGKDAFFNGQTVVQTLEAERFGGEVRLQHEANHMTPMYADEHIAAEYDLIVDADGGWQPEESR